MTLTGIMTCQLMKKLSELINNGKNNEVYEVLKNVDLRNLVNDLGSSLLHIAAENNNVSMVQYLLRRRIDINLQNKDGKTALILAIDKCNSCSINVVLQFQPNLHIEDNKKRNALQMLVQNIYFRLPGIQPIKVYQVLKNECRSDNEKIAKKLINIECPLYTAVHFGNAEILRIMLQNGYSVKQRTKDTWWTALHIAFQVGQLTCVKVLLDYNANVDEKCRYHRNTPFSYYKHFDDSDLELEVWQIVLSRSRLLTRNCYLELRQIRNLLENGKKKVLRALFQSNVDLSASDSLGRTALHYLAKNPTLANDQSLVDLLSTKKLDIHKVAEVNAVCEAARHGSPTLLKFLLDNNAVIKVRAQDQRYPTLHSLWLNAYEQKPTRQKNFYECAKLFLQHGADPQELSVDGNTILDMTWGKINFILTKAVLSHLALVEARNMPIKNLIRDKINSNRWLCNQFNLCKLQLARLNEIRISEFMTLFEFLLKNEEQMAICLRNDELRTALEEIGEKYTNKSEFFNIYWGYLEKSLIKAQVRRYAAELVCDVTDFSYYQHHMIVDGIFRYLTNKDLEIMSIRSS